jgi:hypothetical protein
MSAAATAAGYLYASGRLRGRAAREQEQHEPQKADKPKDTKDAKDTKDRIRVAVVHAREEAGPAPQRMPKTPKIEYRVRRRWSPE